MNDYLTEQQNKYEKSATEDKIESNTIYRMLISHLNLIAIAFLILSTFLKLLTSLIITFSISILFGIAQIIIDYQFFKKWFFAKSNIAKSIYEDKVTESNLRDIAYGEQNNLPKESNKIFLYLQIIAILIGIVAFAILTI